MEADFWHQRWQAGQIGFHRPQVNRLLVQHLPALDPAPGSRVFLPLCGKTLDIGWLLDNGYRVTGAELSEIAIRQLFEELAVTPEVSMIGPFKHYRGENIDVFVGDVFDLTAEMLGRVDAVYDRAALVALPAAMRRHYTAHLMQITAVAPQLLLCFEYDQSQMQGPPFSIVPEEVERHYADHYTLTLLESTPMAGLLKGQVEAIDHVWAMKPGASIQG